MKRWLVVVMLVLAAAAWGQDFERFAVTVDDCEPFVIEMRPGAIESNTPNSITYNFIYPDEPALVRISVVYDHVLVSLGRIEYQFVPAEGSGYFDYWKKTILEATVRAFWPPYRETRIKIARVIQ